jgi:hypothetical protein
MEPSVIEIASMTEADVSCALMRLRRRRAIASFRRFRFFDRRRRETISISSSWPIVSIGTPASDGHADWIE